MNTKKLLKVISFSMTVLTLAVVCVLFFGLPTWAEAYLKLVDKFSQSNLTASIAFGRIALVTAGAGLTVILRLLYIVSRGRVFSSETKHIMAILSLCCFGEMTVFIILGSYFPLSFVVAFTSLMLGILLLVLRCVMAEAIEIKEENDFTV